MNSISIQPFEARLSEMARLAVRSEIIHAIPAELPIAQCAVESEWLQRAPMNNCMGIKWAPRHSLQQSIATFEIYTDAQWLALPAALKAKATKVARGQAGTVKVELALDFAAFLSLEDCFDDHARIVLGTYTKAYSDAYFQYQHQGRNLKAYFLSVCKIYATGPYGDLAWKISQQPNVKQALASAIQRMQ